MAWDLTKVVGGHYADLVVLGIQDECFTSVWSAQDIIEELERQGAVDGLKKTDHRLLVSLSNELVLEPWPPQHPPKFNPSSMAISYCVPNRTP